MDLLEYWQKRNTILINREIGGLGDILMHRMMFEDFSLSGVKVHFSCPSSYIEAVIDHPYLEKVIDCDKVNPLDYCVAYNTTTICGRYEEAIAPKSDLHRSDIWSKHCGLDLIHHDMHICISEREKQFAREILPERPVAFSPISAMPGKSLDRHQICGVIDGLSKMGYSPFVLHQKEMNLGVPSISGLTIRQWMAVVSECDYVISVDTSTFHLAGGLKKPLVGIFSFIDGKTYGKYFDFELVQRHRDNGNWDCGPCYRHWKCPKTSSIRKPCITDVSSEEILQSFEGLCEKTRNVDYIK